MAYTEQLYLIDINASLLSALNKMTEQGIHRLTVVDSKNHVRGVLSSLRVLDVLAGRRGDGIKKREGENLEKLLEEGVHLFVGDYLHQLSLDMSLRGLISYIMENRVCHITLTDQAGTIRGVVTGSCVLNQFPLKEYGIKISDVMTPEVHTLSSQRTIREAIEMLSSYNIRRLPIMEDEEIKGLVNAKELLQNFAPSNLRTPPSEEAVDRIMSKKLGSIGAKKPTAYSQEDDIVCLVEEIRRGEQKAFPILEDGRLVGIATSRDIISELPKVMGITKFLSLIQSEDI
ncbi:MAG: CBS domain-containing protein [Thermoproteota archaeon]